MVLRSAMIDGEKDGGSARLERFFHKKLNFAPAFESDSLALALTTSVAPLVEKSQADLLPVDPTRCDVTIAVSCVQCKRDCSKKRVCKHPCMLACHPDDCPRCEREVLRRCFCVRRSVRSVLCYETREDPIALEAKLSCGEPCHKTLAHCNHRCSQLCHPGECTGSTPLVCTKKVTLRCPCKRIKTEYKCVDAQRLRGKRATTENCLLECDAECAQHREQLALIAQKEAEEAARELELERKQTLRPNSQKKSRHRRNLDRMKAPAAQKHVNLWQRIRLQSGVILSSTYVRVALSVLVMALLVAAYAAVTVLMMHQ